MSPTRSSGDVKSQPNAFYFIAAHRWLQELLAIVQEQLLHGWLRFRGFLISENNKHRGK